MEREIVFRKGNKTHTLTNIFNGLKKQGYEIYEKLTFTDSERKVMAMKDLSYALRVYNFLNDFIANLNEKEFRKFITHSSNFDNLAGYLRKQNLYSRIAGGQFEIYMEDLYTLYVLIYKHMNQKKSIPLDCLLIAYRAGKKKNDIEVLAEELQRNRITDLDTEALQRRISRARNTMYLLKITNLAIKLMPL